MSPAAVRFFIAVVISIVVASYLDKHFFHFDKGWPMMGLMAASFIFFITVRSIIERWLDKEEAVTKMFPGRPTYDLHRAAAEGDIRCMNKLIAEGSKVNFKQSNGATPLHFAIQAGHLDAVKLLMDHGAEVNVQGVQGWTPLMLVFTSGHFHLAPMLVDRGADVTAFLDNGAKALDICVESCAPLEFTELLISHGANVKLIDRTGLTPLHRCARVGNKDVAALLVDHDAKVDANDSKGLTPLFGAAIGGNDEVAAFLLSKGAIATQRSSAGDTPLHYVALGAGEGTFRKLAIAQDIIVAASSSKGPRHYSEVAELLVANGAQVNALNSSGTTPLYQASLGGNAELVKVLLKKGADLSIRCESDSPLIAAALMGHKDVVVALLEAGADVNDKSGGDTVLQKARRNGHREIVALLEKHGAKR